MAAPASAFFREVGGFSIKKTRGNNKLEKVAIQGQLLTLNRHCERSEAIQLHHSAQSWIASLRSQ